jgi:dsRNA-specific ribonuclease
LKQVVLLQQHETRFAAAAGVCDAEKGSTPLVGLMGCTRLRLCHAHFSAVSCRALEPGQLHLLRCQRVSNTNLGAAAARLGLHQHVLLQAAGLAAAVQAAGATGDAVNMAAQQSGDTPAGLQLGQLPGLTEGDARIWREVWGVSSTHASSAAGDGAKTQVAAGAPEVVPAQTTGALGMCCTGVEGGDQQQPSGAPPWPKVLADVVEATAGAVWVDSGGSWQAVWQVVQFMLGDTLPLQGSCPLAFSV